MQMNHIITCIVILLVINCWAQIKIAQGRLSMLLFKKCILFIFVCCACRKLK